MSAASASVLLLALAPPQAAAERAREPVTGRTYLRSKEPLTFHEAAALARASGGTLASVGSAEEETLLLDSFGAEEGYWLGLEFPREVWSSGEPVAFSHWFRGEPGGGPFEPFTVLNWGEPGGWGDVSGDASEHLYRALIEFEPGQAPERLPELLPSPTKRGVLLLGVQDLTQKDLENTRLPHLNELWERSAWTGDAAADAGGDPLASLGMLVWGVGPSRSRLSLAAPKGAAQQAHTSLLARLECALRKVSTASLLDDQAASGILMDGRIDVRVASASVRKGGTSSAAAEALALPAPLCIVAAWTRFAVAGAEPGPEAERTKELAAIDQELGTLLAALRARPDFAAEDWWIALAGLVPPAGKVAAKKSAPEDLRARAGVPLCLLTSARGPGELLGEFALVDLVPSALLHLGLEPRRSFGLDGRALALDRLPAFDTNLLENPGAEAQFGYGASDPVHLTGWRQLGGFRPVPWDPALPGDPGPAVRGKSAFLGSAGARLEQTLDLSSLAAEIDRGVVRCELGVRLGLAKDSTASIELTLACLTDRRKLLEERALALPEPARKDQGLRRAGWTPLTLDSRLPRRTRAVRLALVATGPEALADEVSFVLRRD